MRVPPASVSRLLLLALACGTVAACQGPAPTVTAKHATASAHASRVALTPPPFDDGPLHVAVTVPSPQPSPLAPAFTPPSLLPTPPLPSAAPTPLPPDLVASAVLAGRVAAPTSLLSNNGGSLISDQGGSVLSNNGGALVSDQGGSIISDQGGQLVGNNGSGYHLLATAEGGLAGAFLYLTNRDEKFYLDAASGQAFMTATDASGGYGFLAAPRSAFPVGRDVIVNALTNENQRLTGFLTPVDGKNALDVTVGSTLVTELLRAEAARRGKALATYDPPTVARAVAATETALASGDLPATRQVTGADGKPTTSAAFDLRLQHVDRLRNQYVVAFSAVDAGKQALHQLSDTWKALFGYRPTAVTTVAGNGAVPVVRTDKPTADGDGAAPRLADVAMGYVAGIAVAPGGDVFVTSEGNDSGDGHVRWLAPGGRVGTLWFPGFQLEQPGGLAVERTPGDMTTAPGSVLVAGNTANYVVRTYAVDHALTGPDGRALWPQELVAGEYQPLAPNEPDHPVTVDGPGAQPAVDTSQAKTSLWRLADEGARTYTSTGFPVPNAARYAHLNHPTDVAVDEQGNIYIADAWNQRVRMIPKADGSYYGYRQPLDADADGVVDGFGDPTPMKAGCIYTIAGNPAWDPAKTPDQGGHWFGDYAGDGDLAQQARLADPQALAFHDGMLYVADHDNQRIRRISRATGRIDTVAGNPPGPQQNNGSYYFFPSGTAGDGGPATQAQLWNPQALAVDARGRLYFFDAGSQRVRMIDLAATTPTITTVAGHLPDPLAAFGALDGDGDALWGVTLADVRGLAVDPAGNLLVTDYANRRVRKLWRQWD